MRIPQVSSHEVADGAEKAALDLHHVYDGQVHNVRLAAGDRESVDKRLCALGKRLSLHKGVCDEFLRENLNLASDLEDARRTVDLYWNSTSYRLGAAHVRLKFW